MFKEDECMFKNKEKYMSDVAAVAHRIINNHRSDLQDQLYDLCPDDTNQEKMQFASDVYNYIMEELDRRDTPSICRHL